MPGVTAASRYHARLANVGISRPLARPRGTQYMRARNLRGTSHYSSYRARASHIPSFRTYTVSMRRACEKVMRRQDRTPFTRVNAYLMAIACVFNTSSRHLPMPPHPSLLQQLYLHLLPPYHPPAEHYCGSAASHRLVHQSPSRYASIVRICFPRAVWLSLLM